MCETTGLWPWVNSNGGNFSGSEKKGDIIKDVIAVMFNLMVLNSSVIMDESWTFKQKRQALAYYPTN